MAARLRLLTGPPEPGHVKLRIRSDGSPQGTAVYAYTADGLELEVENVTAVDWLLRLNDVARARLEVAAVDVELEVPAGELVSS